VSSATGRIPIPELDNKALASAVQRSRPYSGHVGANEMKNGVANRNHQTTLPPLPTGPRTHRANALKMVLFALAFWLLPSWGLGQAVDHNANAKLPAQLAGLPAESGPIPTKSIADIALAGGILLIPILVASFVLLVVVFERTISLRRGRILPRPFVRRMLHQLAEGSIDRAEALSRCEENSSHIARVFGAAIRKWGRPAVEVEQAVLDEGERTVNILRRYLRVINGVATVCPLLGLLGTVLGMMQAFNDISASSAIGRPELLAGGISQALVSTAAGMFVAIPAVIFYLYFVGRVDSLVMDIDAKGQELVELISAEGLASGPRGVVPKTKRKKAA